MSTGRQSTLDWFSERLNMTEFLSILSGFGLIYVELDSRKPPRQALAEALARPLPSYARWPRVLGLTVVVLVALEIFTGALLALYYLPTPATAHESVASIQRDVDFGWLVHQVHFWGAQLLILTLMVRVVRYLAHGIYRAPRELEWLWAVGLLAVAVLADLSGRLLLWSSEAYWLGVRVVEALVALPLLGPVIGFLLGGEGSYLSGLTLLRAYGFHVAVVPLATLLLLYLHFSSVRRLGLNEDPEEAKISGADGLRRHLTEVAMVLVVAVTVLVTLAVFSPQAFPCAADPYSTLPTIQLPWHLLAPAGLLELVGGIERPTLGLGLLLALSLAILFVPLVDRRAAGRRRRLWGVAVLVVAWLLLTALAFEASR